MKPLSWLVYIPLQLLAMPLAILGAVLVAYRQLVVSKRRGVSQTAIEVFNGRWTLHVFGMRDDPGAAQLGRVLPNTSTFGLWLALFPLWVKARIAGEPAIYPRRVAPGHETMVDLIPGRTLYFDGVLARRLPQVEQFVLLGAGMDTRPYGALDVGHVRVFEVDQETIQQLKRDTLAAAGIDSDHVTFVTVDFSTEDLLARLTASGYDPTRPTLFLWEGVTPYLSEQAVRQTMARVRSGSAPGSVLLADIYGERFVAFMRSGAGGKMLEYTNEAGNFALPFAKDWETALRTFVESTGLTLGEVFFMGAASRKGPFVVVAEIVV